MNVSFSVNATFDKVYNRSSTPKVELNTHRLWVTNRYEPREMFEYLPNITVYDMILDTNKKLEEGGLEWNHYLWVNERSLLPNTTKWFEEHGFKVKEFRELEADQFVVEKLY